MDDHPSSNARGRDQWNEKAEFWDRLHGDEGNAFHREIVEPAVERLLQLQPGERVLDAACGNGAMARRLATLGADVTAFDFSASLVELARARGTGQGRQVHFLVTDATDEDAVAAIGEGGFDAVVCTIGSSAAMH